MKLLLLHFLFPIFFSLGLSAPLLLLSTRQTPELEAETDRLLFEASIGDFLAARDAQSPAGLDWSTDGCTSAPDDPFGFDFLPSCYRHDFGYRNYKAQNRFSDAGKSSIDRNFKDDLYDQCASEDEDAQDICEFTADVYYEAVVLFGKRDLRGALVAGRVVQ